MSRHLLLCISLFAALAFGQRNRDPVPVAHKAFDLLLQEKYSELRAMFTQTMLDGLSQDALRNQVGPQIKALGKAEKIGDATVQKAQRVDVVVFPCKFTAGNFDFQFSIDDTGKIGGLFFRPGEGPKTSAGKTASSWTQPDYSRPDRFRERDVTVGESEWKLPGNVTIPIGTGPFPGVVLVQGSGPQDRDESISANKPFRDLAEGLASRGVAVLRYDKRTKVYGPQMAALKTITVQQETIEDALAAVALLRQQKEVDPKRIFVLGHSLGGYLGPRIANLDGRLAGLIILAGSFRPMQDLILEQSRYLSATPEQLDQLKQQVTEIDNLKPGESNPPTLLGAPSSYWLDLQSYDPGAQVKAVKCRLLILQGERDYQVTQQDFAMWQAALKGGKDVTFHAYPALNHLFIAGEGKSLPAEYSKPGHVAAQAIDDIATWIERAT